MPGLLTGLFFLACEVAGELRRHNSSPASRYIRHVKADGLPWFGIAVATPRIKKSKPGGSCFSFQKDR
jgi:hypothetical protein